MNEIVTVPGFYGNAPKIVWQKIEEYTNRVAVKLNLMDIFDHERGLCDGRFANFTQEPQELKITVRLGKSGDEVAHNMRRHVEWIATQTRKPWSFDVKYKSVTDPLDMTFSFEDVTAGVLFKLVWYRPLR